MDVENALSGGCRLAFMGLQRSGQDHGDQVQPGGAPPKLRVRRGPDGKLRVGDDPSPTTETVEAAERPPTPDDPRTGVSPYLPPIGPG